MNTLMSYALIAAISNALDEGVMHYDAAGNILDTPEVILAAMRAGQVMIMRGEWSIMTNYSGGKFNG